MKLPCYRRHLLLSIVFCVWAFSSVAAPMQLLVDNVRVTPQNASNVLAGMGSGKDGCVSFDYKTHTLTLRDAKLTKRITITGETPDQLITVRLEGENELISTTYAFQIYSPVLVEGPGSLLIRSTGKYARGFMLAGTQRELYLKIRKTNVRVEAGPDGEAVFSPNVRDGYVVLEETDFYSEGLVAGMKEIYLQGCEIANDNEVYLGYRDDGCAVVASAKDNKYNYGPLEIHPNRDYPIALGSTQITKDNAEDILAEKGQSGAARYDNASNTLYLKNLQLDEANENGLFTRFCPIDAPLNIVLEGDSKIRSDYSGMLLFGNTHIKGPGRLTLIASDDQNDFAGIMIADEDTLTVEGCEISCSGTFGMAGIRMHSRLVVRDALVEAHCQNSRRGACFEGFDSITLEKAEITEPEGAYFDKELYGITADGVKLCKDFVRISKRSAISGPEAETDIRISTTPGMLTVTLAANQSARSLAIYTMNGTLLCSQPCKGSASIALPTGYYMLHIGSTQRIIFIP